MLSSTFDHLVDVIPDQLHSFGGSDVVPLLNQYMWEVNDNVVILGFGAIGTRDGQGRDLTRELLLDSVKSVRRPVFQIPVIVYPSCCKAFQCHHACEFLRSCRWKDRATVGG